MEIWLKRGQPKNLFFCFVGRYIFTTNFILHWVSLLLHFPLITYTCSGLPQYCSNFDVSSPPFYDPLIFFFVKHVLSCTETKKKKKKIRQPRSRRKTTLGMHMLRRSFLKTISRGSRVCTWIYFSASNPPTFMCTS